LEVTSLTFQVRALEKWNLNRDHYLPSSRILTLLPAVLILSALFIHVAAGRWGGYIVTPIPGLYLPEALLTISILASIPNFHKLKDLPPLLGIVFTLPIVYIGARLIEWLASGASQNTYLVVRDLAPFAYLSLVPLIAVSLFSVPFSWILWVLRISSLIHVIAVALVSWQILSLIPTSFIEPDASALFDYRGDLQGVIVGIGLISWGKWPGWVGANRYVQFALLVFVWNLGSRAALVTALFCLLLVAFRERKWLPVWRLILLTVGALLTLLALNGALQLTDTTVQEVVEESETKSQLTDTTVQEVVEESETKSQLTDTTVQEVVEESETKSQLTDTTVQEVVEESEIHSLLTLLPAVDRVLLSSESGVGTARARLATYSLILEYLPQNTFWLFGAGPGTDILYTICTGIPNAPPRTSVETAEGRSFFPKCPIDDADANSTLRDPHNWLLNLLVHNGTVGALIFLIAVGAPVYWSRNSSNSSLGLLVIAAYFVCGTFGVIISAPFAMLPIAVMLGWMVKSTQSLIENPVRGSL
jgi:hypothetical protein